MESDRLSRELTGKLEAARMTAEGLSLDADLARDTVGRWIRGNTVPTLAALQAVEDVLSSRLGHPVDLAAGARERREARRAPAKTTPADPENTAQHAALQDRPRTLGQWTAQQLGVHPAISGDADAGDGDSFVLPVYYERQHDRVLRQKLTAAARGRETVLVIVRGESCTGKTRTAFEAVHACLPDWNLVFPKTADSLHSVLRDGALFLKPRTVLWLNEAQDFFTGPGGETAAAMVRSQLEQSGPVVIVLTLWSVYYRQITLTPAPGEDHHPQARALFDCTPPVDVPNWFTGRELRGLSALADDENDHSLATAASSSPNGEITQTLAAGPQLIDYYEHAADPRDCYGKAIITAAMDARRLGHASTLPAALLQAAAPGYLTDDQRKQARAAWFAEGLQYARKKVRNVVAALNDVPRPTGMGAVPDVYRLADYLDQYGRSARCTHCPPASFWDAVQKYVTSATELDTLADAAQKMGRYQIATAVAQRAAQSGGGFGALYRLAEMRKEARNWDEAKQIYRYIANASQADDTLSRGEIFRMLMHASQDTLPGAPQGLVQMWDEVSRLFPNIPRSPDQATAQDYLDATHNVLNTPQGRNRVRGKATEDFSDPVRRGLPDTPLNRGHAREKSGDLDGAERLYLQAAAKGDRYAPLYLARLYGKTGRLADAEPLWRDLASTPNWSYTAEAKAYLALTRQKMFIARIQEESQTRPDAQRLYQQAADTGHTLGPSPLTQAPEAASIPDDSEQPFQQARNANGAIHPETLSLPIEEWREAYLGRKSVLLSREGAGDSLGAERMAQQAAEVGDSLALLALAHIREQAGDPQSAEQLAVQAINVGSALHADLGLMALADMRKRAGNREDSQRTRRFGLNADGSPENADPESNSAADDLVIRRTEAARLEKSGQYAQAVDLWRSLIDSYTGTLGPNHAGTLESRHELAICLSKSAGGAAAIAVWRPLVQDRSRVLGIDHPDTLRTRYCLAVNLWGLGEDAEAEAMSRPLINDCVRVLGPDDPMTLAARENLALSLGGLGRLTEAITVLQALVEDRARVLGVDHHDTLTSRYSLARYLEDSGRSTEAVELFQPLVEDCARVCGADNFLTLDARYGLAVSLGKTRIATKALPLWRSLVDDLTRVRGPDDSRTLGARFLLAVTLGAQRRYAESVDVLRPLARDRTRILGADHTDTVATRQLLHGCLGLRTSRSRRGRGPR